MSGKQSKILRKKIQKESFTIIQKFIEDLKKLKFSARLEVACKILKIKKSIVLSVFTIMSIFSIMFLAVVAIKIYKIFN